jgi:hypothetical protein
MERLPALAADLVRLGVDVIVTGNISMGAAMKATATIPIVSPNEVGAVCGKAARTVLCGGRAMKRASLPLQRNDFRAQNGRRNSDS